MQVQRRRIFSIAFVVLLSVVISILQTSTALAARSLDPWLKSPSISHRDRDETCSPQAVSSDTLSLRYGRSRSTLSNFVASTWRTDPATVIGVFVCHVLALEVYQQPVDDPVFVSELAGTATQFRLAAAYGTIGLLAHSQRSGSRFFELALGQEVDIVYGDGTVRPYIVSEIRHLRSVSPDDPRSDYIDFERDGARLSSTQLFNQIFARPDKVVFQTCIEAGSASWGRLFVTATRLFDDRE
jgi:hypothetical protein